MRGVQGSGGRRTLGHGDGDPDVDPVVRVRDGLRSRVPGMLGICELGKRGRRRTNATFRMLNMLRDQRQRQSLSTCTRQQSYQIMSPTRHSQTSIWQSGHEEMRLGIT